MSEPTIVVRNKVQAKLNEALPPTEQRPMLKLFAINLPEDMVADYEEQLETMMYMEGVRDGDNTQTMRQKSMGIILWASQQWLAQELAEAMKLKRAAEGVDDSPDFPDDED